jgi:hypothetical protein
VKITSCRATVIPYKVLSTILLYTGRRIKWYKSGDLPISEQAILSRFGVVVLQYFSLWSIHWQWTYTVLTALWACAKLSGFKYIITNKKFNKMQTHNLGYPRIGKKRSSKKPASSIGPENYSERITGCKPQNYQ